MAQPETTDGRVLVGATGDVYTAPAGTAAPIDIDVPGTPWIKLGLISEDGATWTPPAEETTDIKAWQSPYPQRTVTTALTTSLQFGLMEWDKDTLPFALGGGTFVDDAVNFLTTYKPPLPGEAENKALFLKVLDGPIKMGIYYPKGRITSRDDTAFNPGEPALLNVTFGILGDPNITDPYQLIFDTPNLGGGSLLSAQGVAAQQQAPEYAEAVA